ncbi:MAG: hydantoinase B/oxoprolinase family protein, partial [Chloroflexota bacterium]
VGVCLIGEVRVQDLMDKYGEDRILDSFEDLMDSTERRIRAGIRQWRDGKAEMEAFLDPDGIVVHKPVRLHLAVTKEGDNILFDFSGCDDQTNAPLNLKPAAAMSAVYFALIAMIDPTLPNNDGLGRAIQTRFRPGSVVSPEPPAAVSCYTVTLGMVREIVVAAMTKIAHQKAIACNGGLPVVTIGGKSLMTGRTYIQYEIGGAGCGAVDGDDGRAGHVGLRGAPGHVRTVPVEIVESEFACRILRYELIPDSGGPGKFRGGPAWVKDYLVLDDEARLGLRSSMYVFAAWGVEGGMHGRPGTATLNPGTPQERRLPPRIADVRLKRGDILRMESGGGGGVGNPRERPREKVLEDVEDGYVSEAQAKGIYGLASL